MNLRCPASLKILTASAIEVPSSPLSPVPDSQLNWNCGTLLAMNRYAAPISAVRSPIPAARGAGITLARSVHASRSMRSSSGIAGCNGELMLPDGSVHHRDLDALLRHQLAHELLGLG